MHHNSAQIPHSLWRFLYFLTTAILKLNYSGSDGKESACNAGDLGLNPGWGRVPGEGTGNPLQYSCLENPIDSGAWQATVHGVTESQTWLSDFTFFLSIKCQWKARHRVKGWDRHRMVRPCLIYRSVHCLLERWVMTLEHSICNRRNKDTSQAALSTEKDQPFRLQELEKASQKRWQLPCVLMKE